MARGSLRRRGAGATEDGPESRRNLADYADGKLHINYFLNRRSDHAVMTTGMPAMGEARISVRRTAEVIVRVPSWLKPEQLTLTVDSLRASVAADLDKTRRHVALGRIDPGARISIRFPLAERTTRERIAGIEYGIRWRGNYVVGMSPTGTNFPLFP